MGHEMDMFKVSIEQIDGVDYTRVTGTRDLITHAALKQGQVDSHAVEGMKSLVSQWIDANAPRDY